MEYHLSSREEALADVRSREVPTRIGRLYLRTYSLLHILRMWEKNGVPGKKKTRKDGENMHVPHRKAGAGIEPCPTL